MKIELLMPTERLPVDKYMRQSVHKTEGAIRSPRRCE